MNTVIDESRIFTYKPGGGIDLLCGWGRGERRARGKQCCPMSVPIVDFCGIFLFYRYTTEYYLKGKQFSFGMIGSMLFVKCEENQPLTGIWDTWGGHQVLLIK